MAPIGPDEIILLGGMGEDSELIGDAFVYNIKKNTIEHDSSHLPMGGETN